MLAGFVGMLGVGAGVGVGVGHDGVRFTGLLIFLLMCYWMRLQ